MKGNYEQLKDETTFSNGGLAQGIFESRDRKVEFLNFELNLNVRRTLCSMKNIKINVETSRTVPFVGHSR